MTRLSLDLSAFHLTGVTRALAGAARGLGSTVRKLPAQALEWHERRKGLEALGALNDYQLRDIGVCRSEIVMVAYGLKDPHETPEGSSMANAVTRPIPSAQQADNSDHDPCVGRAA